MNGVYSLTGEQYRAADGVSKSALDYIAEPFTPAHYRARFVTGELVDGETDAKRLGSLTHRVILEPDTLAGAFHVKPEGMNFTTKEGKAWRTEHSDRLIITHEEAVAIKGMREAVWKHPKAKRLLKGAKMEQSLFATDEHGVLRKARLDALTAGNVIPDLKTVLDTTDHWFARQNEEHRWYVQAAYYIDLCALLGIEKEDFVFICVEKIPPYDVVCRSVAQLNLSHGIDLLELGRRCYRHDMALLRDCMAKNHWPGRSDEFEAALLPPWRMNQLEQEAA